MISSLFRSGWNPGWPIAIFACVFIPLFLVLGTWQVQRAEHKERLLQRVAEVQAQPPVSLEQALGRTDPNFAAVEFAGAAQPERLIYLDNRVRDGLPGVEVLLPVRTGSGMVLVNLGYLPKPGRIDFPTPPVLPGQVSVSGYLYRPDKPRVVLSEQELTQWPRVLQRLDWDLAGRALGEALIPWQVRIDSTSPYALTTDWTVSVSGPERHRGYAFQWFAMAFALTILFIIVGVKRAPR